ncbi:MAG: oligosaccharide flippase family protein, partial [Firmicutes bacterium]|nr:oligosaccharide flippase family protein [Bacillota bacterium]
MRWPKICRQRPVLTNIAILTGSAFLERLLGGFYRVALARASGPEALGLLQYCLPFLRLGGILGTLGIPQALTREVAEALARGRQDEAEAMTAWALRAVGLAGAGLALALSLLPPVFRSLFPDPRVLPLFRWLGPVVVFSSLGMVLQGGLQGQNRMWPLALAGFVAQLGKLGLGLFLIGRVAPRGPSPIASAALAAMAASEFVSCGLLFA